MPKTIKYTGAQDRWSELPVTGKQSNWRRGQQEERSDAEAAQLLGTGLFQQVLGLTDLPIPALVSGDGIQQLATAPLLTPMPVSVRNPHPFACPNEPVAVLVKFRRGQVPSAACLRVLDSGGAVVPWQWDPARHPNTDSPAGHYSDGSLRAGRMWFMASFTANQVRDYTIQVSGSPFGDVFTPAVEFVSDSAVLKSFQTAQIKVQFDSARAWQLKNAFDRANENANLNATANGVYHINQLSSGVTKISYTAADVTNTAGAELGSSNYGYGVVFRDWEASFQYAAETSTTVRTRYRFFANNRLYHDNRWTCTAAQASASRVWKTEVAIKDATSVPTNASDPGWISATYGGVLKTLFGWVAYQSEYPAADTRVHSTQYINTASATSLGWAASVDMPKGAYFTMVGFVSFLPDSAANELLRVHNNIQAVAQRYSDGVLRQAVRDGIAQIARAWEPEEAADTNLKYGGSRALARMALSRHDGVTPDVTAALVLYERWAFNNSIDPASGAAIHARWNVPNNVGLEFIGPAGACLPALYAEAVRQGLTSTAATIASYIHALADFAVLAEVTSGGGGKMLLKGSEIDNYNARGTAMTFLAASLALQSNAGRLDTLTRMANAYPAAYAYGHKLPYSPDLGGGLNMVVKFMRASYHGYNIAQIVRAHRYYPCLPSQIDYRSFACEYLGPLTVAEEIKYNKQLNRKGLPSNLSAFTLPLVLGQTATGGDWQLCADIVQHLASKILSGKILDQEIDGWRGVNDGTLSAAWGGSDAPSVLWHLLYELAAT